MNSWTSKSATRRVPNIEERSTTVATYAQLCRYVDAFARGYLNLVILTGGTGLAKTYTLRSRLGEQACWLDGTATAFGIYTSLFSCRDRMVVIDNAESLFGDARCVQILQSLCQSEVEKRVAWHTAATGLGPERIPRQFVTKSRLFIIANEWQNLNRNVCIVSYGGHLIWFRPSPAEVHAQVKTWFADREILEWFERHLSLFRELSMTNYIRASELKQAGLDWIDTSLPRPLPGRTRLVARLRDEASFRSEEERVRAFINAGGGCRATYFNHVRKLRSIRSSIGNKHRFKR